MPLSALGLTAEQVTEIREKWKIEKEANDEGQNGGDDVGNDIDMNGEGDLDTLKSVKSFSEPDSISKTASNDALDTLDDGKSMGRKLTELLEEKLPDIVTKQKADDFSTSFCYVNSRASRKKLASSLDGPSDQSMATHTKRNYLPYTQAAAMRTKTRSQSSLN